MNPCKSTEDVRIVSNYVAIFVPKTTKCSEIFGPEEKDRSCGWTQCYVGSNFGLDGVLLKSFPLSPLRLVGNLLLILKVSISSVS